jgi:arabinofuranan 3-O-arabinosyltransferase
VGVASDTVDYVIPKRYWAWLGTRRAVAILLWLVTLSVASYILVRAWSWFGNNRFETTERQRVDGNSGHVQIDFGGQWVMGRMVVMGYARELYHRQRQWEVVREGFRVEDEPPLVQEESSVARRSRQRARPDEDLKHDADRLMGWFMGSDPGEWRTVGGAAVTPLGHGPLTSPLLGVALEKVARDAVTPEVAEAVTKPAVGGPLYPPVHAFLYAPLSTLRPIEAYHVFQVIGLLMVFVAGLGVKVLSRGRIWWSVATLVLLLYSGNRAGLDLAQNPAVTLAIAVWGWALASRGYNTAGGVVWGLFAFKPVWALAFSIVPLLTRRWRFCAAMVVTGVSLCAATLPFVGVQTWFDWLAVGKEAAQIYNVNQNWISLSRDLQSVPRRILHDFNVAERDRDTVLAQTLAWSLWATVFVSTVVIYLRYADYRRATGTGAAFLLFGAWLTCYRFMYYDALVSALGCAALFAEPARFLRTRQFVLSPPADPHFAFGRELTTPPPPPLTLGARVTGYVSSLPVTILALLLIVENSLNGMALEGTVGFGYYGRVTTGPDGGTGRTTPRLVVDTSTNYPWETFLILAMWIWCGRQLVKGEERQSAAK